ncbi:amino acid ABC transporter permease [Celeribacter indicus]|uniref:Polar amino acid ABC transporter inner membrane subunit n=2 Tax=Celeribacter indicus TaxID=1208324 RepID=A0A0B5E181_9RHOB|nr:polar amino acid ABC transporter inner membrane subunit [Celeribacter indicus]SDX06028.1 amino acid ABC transporter membrane protein 2, PAAT family [Celeribacter indicus]
MTNMILSSAHVQFLLWGATWTLALSAIAMAGGGLIGFVVALSRISPLRIVRVLALLYVQLIQGTPLLVLIFLIFFGLPGLGWDVSALGAASAALIVWVGAYLGEIWRGCIQAVPRAQWEAAECLALTRAQRMRYAILPQAVKIATPPTVGFLVQLVKNTSLASVVGFVELARAGQILNNTLFQPFLIYLIIAGLYFLMCYPLSVLSRRLETRVGYSRRKMMTA